MFAPSLRKGGGPDHLSRQWSQRSWLQTYELSVGGRRGIGDARGANHGCGEVEDVAMSAAVALATVI